MTTENNSIETRFVDRPEVHETFADSLRMSMFDGQALKIELCVSYLDPPQEDKPPTMRQYPACRLVLTPSAGVELFNRLQQLMAVLEQQGAVKRESIAPKIVQ